MKTAIVTGARGQAGSTLCDHLLSLGYRVIGTTRYSGSGTNALLLDAMKHPQFSLAECEITDATSVASLVQRVQPDEFYNAAAMSHVYSSFGQPHHTVTVNVGGVLNCLEAVRHFSPRTRFLQFSSSEMFGASYSIDPASGQKYQDEQTPFAPCSPYAVSKVAAYHLVNNYAAAYGLFAASLIAFNYESPRRGTEFVTRKITKWIGERSDNGRLRWTDEPKLRLGNLDAYRDWGHCADYVAAAHLILQHDRPDNFVIATGQSHTVRELLEVAFSTVGRHGGLWERSVEIDDTLKRPTEVPYLCGRAEKAKRLLGWSPTRTFEQLVHEMVWADIDAARRREAA
jgi:GDPmannose 4,6-dehydratase